MTKIEWCDKTINPIVGCTKVSEACTNCYAAKMAYRLAHIPATAEKYKGLTCKTGDSIQWTGKVHFDSTDLNKILKWKKPKRIFISSMGDLFHETVESKDIEAIIGIMSLCAQHIFIILTKRPERMFDWFSKYNNIGQIQSELPYHLIEYRTPIRNIERGDSKYINKYPLPNLWLGVTCENQRTADERIPILLEIPATVRFVSCEPLLSPIDLTQYLHRLNQCIVGAETGYGKRPMEISWALSLRNQCIKAGVPFFFKKDSNGNHELAGMVYEEYPL